MATTVDDQDHLNAKPTAHEEGYLHDRLTDEELVVEAQLLKKVDRRIMPWIILVYLMNYIDRNNYAAARLQGLEEDLKLTGDQYQVGLSILFVGYVLMQVPSNALLNYAGRPSLYLGFFTVAWGFVSAMTSLVTNYGGIVAARLILGIVEAPFFAGVLFYLSKWYKKEELAKRMAVFYTGSLVSGAFGNLIAAGILSGLAGDRGLSAWQWLYIIEGVITIAIGLIVAIILPDFPDTWKKLSPIEKRVANRRLALEGAEADIDEAGGMSQIKGIKLAFSDPKTYILSLAYLGTTGAAGFQNFFPSLTSTLGFSRTISLLLVAPPYVFMVVYSFFHSYFSDKLQNRFWFLSYPVANGPIYAWISTSLPRPPAKRAAALAFINSVGNSASIWTPFLYYKSAEPHYYVAFAVNIGLELLALVCYITLRYVLVKQNRELERLENESTQLTEDDVRNLERTAAVQGVSVEQAKLVQKGYRYML